RNAGIGILAEGDVDFLTDLQLKNVQIYNSAVSGLMAENAEIHAENLVINNSGQASLHLRDGNYHFLHSTITNYRQQSFRQYPAVFLENLAASGSAPLTVSFHSSIIFGNEKRELLYNIDPSAAFEPYFSHTLMKFTIGDDVEHYDFSNTNTYNNIWLNEEPIFANPKEND